MQNFAEEIAFWYFRLNGFFLINNYVSHKSESQTNSYGDCDLIGIRPNNVKEIIGLLNPSDTCSELRKIIPNINNKFIGIICEIKGGDSNTYKLNEEKLKSCIKRLGLLDNNRVLNNAIKSLSTSTNFASDNIEIHKIFAPTSNSQIEGWHKIGIMKMVNFLKERITKYHEKGKAWNHYNSILLQYLLFEFRENVDKSKGAI